MMAMLEYSHHDKQTFSLAKSMAKHIVKLIYQMNNNDYHEHNHLLHQ
jgi:hypothetical protein